MTKFTYENMRDDNQRLNQHTKQVLTELDEMIKVWHKQGFDTRAIYEALAIMHQYLGRAGIPRLGETYIVALEAEAHKLAQAMLQRDEYQ